MKTKDIITTFLNSDISVFVYCPVHGRVSGILVDLRDDKSLGYACGGCHEFDLNLYEKTCKEFLKGCSVAGQGEQETCPECLKAFCDRLRQLAADEGHKSDPIFKLAHGMITDREK